MSLRSWIIWIASIVAVTLSTRNPFYLLLVLLIVQIIGNRVAHVQGKNAPIWWLRFGAFAIPLSAFINAISVHFGDTVLFAIPGSIPLISGIVTLEALAYGALSGVLITVVIAVFAVFNIAVPSHQLVRNTPRVFQSMGITIGIALSFIPQTIRHLKEVREAQSVRGHRIRGIRDWLPLWLPLLIGGLEQSTQLSEAMVARGFGATQGRTASLRTRALLTAGLALILAGWLIGFLIRGSDLVGVVIIVAGAVFVIYALWRSGRAVPHTIYIAQVNTVVDSLSNIASIAIAALMLIPNPLFSQASLQYYPYPTLTPPVFDPLSGIIMLFWLLPLLTTQRAGSTA
jgi:energy-coupling factor transport system permease protein